MDLTEYRVEPPAEGGPPEPPVRVALSPKSILVWVAVTAGAVLALVCVYLAKEAITWVLVAAFFAMALNPAVGALERRGVGRGRAAAIVFVVAFAALGLLGFLVIPPLITATTDFVEALPEYLRDLDAERGPLAFLEQRFHVGEQLVEIHERSGIAGLLGLESPGASTARAAADTALGLIAVPFLTFFMLLDGRRWVESVVNVMPPTAQPRWERVFDGIDRTVGGYVTGNLLISLIAGTVAAVTLLAAGVPYALPLAVIVAILDLIPLVGATVGVVVCSVAALSVGVVPAVIVVAVLLVYQQLENHVLQPVVYGRTVELSPLGVLVAVLIGAEIAGVLGALAAIPVAGSISVIASELVRWRREASLHLSAAVQDGLQAHSPE